jgi:hypothetical protein
VTRLEQLAEATANVKRAADFLEDRETTHAFHTKQAANAWDEILKARRALQAAEHQLLKLAKNPNHVPVTSSAGTAPTPIPVKSK